MKKLKRKSHKQDHKNYHGATGTQISCAKEQQPIEGSGDVVVDDIDDVVNTPCFLNPPNACRIFNHQGAISTFSSNSVCSRNFCCRE